jgi:hypothetical protein
MFSAAAQEIIGPTLLGEAILVIGALALGTLFTFGVAIAVGRSVLLAGIATALVIAITPRLYAYPKILVFALLLFVLWRYIIFPSLGRLVALSAATSFAFLMRHDFGIYAAITVAVGLISVHGFAVVRRMLNYALIALLFVSPYLLWLQWNGRLAGDTSSGAVSLLGAPRLVWPPLRVNFGQGLALISPIRAYADIQWAEAVDPSLRAQLEKEYRLIPIRTYAGEDRAFHYGLVDDSVENLRRLINDEHVQDTNGIDRRTALPVSSRWVRQARASLLGRFRWAPLFNTASAEAWLYYLFWALPLTTIGVIALSGIRERLSDEVSKLVLSTAILAILLNLFLIRGSLDSRLPDVVVPASILVGWLVRRHVDWSVRFKSRFATAFALGPILALGLGTWIALTVYVADLSALRLASAPFRVGRVLQVASSLNQRPIDTYAPAGSKGIRAVTRYVNACTTPQDRLLLVAYEPQVFYYSERLFAGGMAFFHQRRFSSERDQTEIVRKLTEQQVPLVVVKQDRLHMFEDDYSKVFEHVRGRYDIVEAGAFDGEYLVLANRNRVNATTDEGLPCFTESRAGDSVGP